MAVRYFFSRDKKEAMNNAMILVFAIMLAFVMGALPFGYFTVLPQVLGIPEPLGIPMLIGFIVLAAMISYLAALGSGTFAQSSNCGEIKSMGRVAESAVYGMVYEVVFIAIALFVPMIGTVTSDYFVGKADPLFAKQVDVAFWGVWGALYGIAVAATKAATC